MAFVLQFSTVDHNQGMSILIEDASTGTPFPTLTAATFVITSLYSGTVITGTTVTKTFTQTIASGFSLEITNTDLGFASADPIPDSIYHIIMTVTGSTDTYTSDEVVYYNAKYVRDNFISEKAAYIDDVYSKDIDYANWLDFLITSIEANTVSGNSSAIYYIFNVFHNLDD
jgi:hypothetical protein